MKNMHSALGGLVLPDHLTSALENRAYREGLLLLDDYALAEIQRPAPGHPTVDEDTAIDALCLYENFLANSRRFNFDRINAFAEAEVLTQIPSARHLKLDLVRTSFEVDASEASLFDATFKLEVLGKHLQELNLAERHLLAVREEASFEAQFLLRRDLGWYLMDAQRNFEGDEHGLEPDPFTRNDVTHAAAAAFLQRNMFWIVEHLDCWHDSEAGLVLDSSELWDVPSDVRAPLMMFSRSLRFESYFRFLQERFFSLFEAAFISRALGVENSYQRAPVRPLSQEQPFRAVAAAKVIRVKLADVAEFFPLPRCVAEALEIRSHPKMVAFRQALERWLMALSEEDALEQRLRREVEKANRELRSLARWKSMKDHPLVFGVKTAMSFVPVVGQVTAIVDAIDYFAERRIRARTAWLMTPRSRFDS